MDYRNELKFELSDYDLTRIKMRLTPLMYPDIHQGPEGYLVKSLYFDDLYDSCASEKENGIHRWEKYRIRQYGNSLDFIRLEKKIKCGNMSQKMSRLITLHDYNTLLSDDADAMYDLLFQNKDNLLGELAYKIRYKKFSPKCIVQYERYGLVENNGNVRITFDRNITGSRQITGFFDSDSFMIPLMPQGHHILEIKYDELLPQYILQTLDLGNLRKQSYSKYYQTRAAIG